MVKQVMWTSMVDYPNHISTVLFLGSCNFKCSYCYNKELYALDNIDFDSRILPKLIERKQIINHIILSGGECTSDTQFEEILQKLYLNGFVIGIHTNGSKPDIIEKNIDKISYLGIDIKTSFEKYNDITGITINKHDIIKTVELAVKNNKQYECRTTVFPVYVDWQDCINIAILLKKLNVNKYVLQQYYVVGSAQKVIPYSVEYLKKIQIKCNEILHTDLKVK